MPVASLRDWIDERTRLLPLNVEQYHAMIAGGILEEGAPFELLDGYMVRKDRSAAGEDPMTVGHDHAWVVKTLADLSRRFKRLGCHVQTQQPITLPPHHEPEPDAAIIVGTKDDYRERHPEARDVLCVIEVSDASLRHDRIVKGRIYADSGIAQYVILNLAERVAEVCTQPLPGQGRYGRSITVTPGQSVVFPADQGRELRVPLKRLLP